MYKCEAVKPYESEGGKKEQVEKMFDRIADNYDAMNRTMTMRLDIGWRKKAVDVMRKHGVKKVMDVATGTGDMAIMLCEELGDAKVVGIDLSEGMLDKGRMKLRAKGLEGRIEMKKEDVMEAEETQEYDGVMSAFGVRNFQDLEGGLKKMGGQLRTGGVMVILEMSEPYKVFVPFYKLYTKLVIPFLGWMVSKDKNAYSYLPTSIAAFPHGRKMKEIMERAGLKNVVRRRFTFGVCSMYLGEKESGVRN